MKDLLNEREWILIRNSYVIEWAEIGNGPENVLLIGFRYRKESRRPWARTDSQQPQFGIHINFIAEVIFYFWREAVITAGNWWMVTSINSKRIYQGRLRHICESEGTDILIVKKSLPKNCVLLRSELRVESFRISFLGVAKNKSSATDV